MLARSHHISLDYSRKLSPISSRIIACDRLPRLDPPSFDFREAYRETGRNRLREFLREK